MIVLLLAFFFFYLGGVPTGTPALCRNPQLTSAFADYTNDNLSRWSSKWLHETFGTPDAIMCLKRWAEDGGELDGVPLDESTQMSHQEGRLNYRDNALRILGQLKPNDPTLAQWIRNSRTRWPERLRDTALMTLAYLKDMESLPLLREEALAATDEKKELKWGALVWLNPDSAEKDLEPVANSEKDLTTLRSVVSSARGPVQVINRIDEKLKAMQTNRKRE